MSGLVRYEVFLRRKSKFPQDLVLLVGRISSSKQLFRNPVLSKRRRSKTWSNEDTIVRSMHHHGGAGGRRQGPNINQHRFRNHQTGKFSIFRGVKNWIGARWNA